MEQGQATFRPGSVRHAGTTVKSGLRYVIGGFIAVAGRVEHVRRLNERGNFLLLEPQVDSQGLRRAAQLFEWALLLNHKCSLCYLNSADAYLRLQEPRRAEEALRAHIELLPRDSDGHFTLGLALRAQNRQAVCVRRHRSTNPPQTRSALSVACATRMPTCRHVLLLPCLP